MKCIYYSTYPYKSEDFKVVQNPINPRSDVYDMPLRLYKAAECITADTDDTEAFLDNCWEVLDMPSIKVETIYPKYTLDGVTVTPTKYFYGATNDCDGVYEVNDSFYVRKYGEWIKFPTIKEALDCIARTGINSRYLKGIDYEVITE